MRATVLMIIGVLIISIVLFGTVSADMEPNSDPASAEIVERGTHTGSVSELEDDYADWYRVENLVDGRVHISVKTIDYQDTEYINVDSYGAYAIAPDGQVSIYVGHEDKEDSCQWDDMDEMGTLYLSVTGNGQYELKIEYETGGEDQGNRCVIFIWALVIIGIIGLVVGGLFLPKWWGKRHQ